MLLVVECLPIIYKAKTKTDKKEELAVMCCSMCCYTQGEQGAAVER